MTNHMNHDNNPPPPIASYVLQVLALLVGIALILSRGRWGDPVLVFASGLFFVNIFWTTLVLSHDLKMWAWLRNSMAGGVFMLGLILANLAFVFIRAVMQLF